MAGTGTVERLVGSYNAWAANGAARAPSWLKELRAGGIGRFAELGFPSMKQEAWRFTNVAPIAEGSFDLAKVPARIPTLDDIRPYLLLETGPRLVFVDGFFQPALSTPFFDDVQSLAHVVQHRPELVREHLGKYAAIGERPFSAAKRAGRSSRPMPGSMKAGPAAPTGRTRSRRSLWATPRASITTACNARGPVRITWRRRSRIRAATAPSTCISSRSAARSRGTTSAR